MPNAGIKHKKLMNDTQATDADIVYEAVLNACKNLQLQPEEHDRILQFQLKDAQALAEDAQSMEICLQFLRLYRSLDSVTRNDLVSAEWLRNHNTVFNQTPLEKIKKSKNDLTDVIAYLDSRRAIV